MSISLLICHYGFIVCKIALHFNWVAPLTGVGESGSEIVLVFIWERSSITEEIIIEIAINPLAQSGVVCRKMSNISSTSKLPHFHRPPSSWESQVLYKHKYIWLEEAWPMGMFWFFPEITHWSLVKESGRVPRFPDLQCFVLADRQYLLQAACVLAAFTGICMYTAEGMNTGSNLW